jgi:activator of 2-hydroxyglutaryl-CoA dehydratase
MSTKIGIDIGSDTIKAAIINGSGPEHVEKIEPMRIGGKTVSVLQEMLRKLLVKTGNSDDEIKVAITGSGAPKISPIIGIEALPEIDALAASMEILDGEVEHVIEIGAESQK